MQPVVTVLSTAGSTGSFNDVYISPANHHAIKERDVGKVNDRLTVLSAGIYELARELQDEEQLHNQVGTELTLLRRKSSAKIDVI